MNSSSSFDTIKILWEKRKHFLAKDVEKETTDLREKIQELSKKEWLFKHAGVLFFSLGIPLSFFLMLIATNTYVPVVVLMSTTFMGFLFLLKQLDARDEREKFFNLFTEKSAPRKQTIHDLSDIIKTVIPLLGSRHEKDFFDSVTHLDNYQEGFIQSLLAPMRAFLKEKKEELVKTYSSALNDDRVLVIKDDAKDFDISERGLLSAHTAHAKSAE